MGAAAHQKLRAEFGKHRAVLRDVFLVAVHVVHIDARDPVALCHLRSPFPALSEFRHLSRWERSDRITRCDPGEGFSSIERPYPLTPTLSPWERGRTFDGARSATIISPAPA